MNLLAAVTVQLLLVVNIFFILYLQSTSFWRQKLYLQSTSLLLLLATNYKFLETKSSPTIYKKFSFFLADSTTQNTPNLQPTKGCTPPWEGIARCLKELVSIRRIWQVFEGIGRYLKELAGVLRYWQVFEGRNWWVFEDIGRYFKVLTGVWRIWQV